MPDLNDETALRPTASGYLESPRTDRISTSQKQIIVSIYAEKGNMFEACAAAGVQPRVLRQMRTVDEQLNAAIAEAERGFVERAKGYMLEHMARPGNYMDRVTIARRFEPGVWGNTVDVNVKHSLERVNDLAERAKAYQGQAGAPIGAAGRSAELDRAVKGTETP